MKHHKIFIGITVVFVMVIGLLFGVFMTSNEVIDIQVVNFAFMLTTTILLLMIGGLVLELKYEIIHKTDKKPVKNRSKKR